MEKLNNLKERIEQLNMELENKRTIDYLVELMPSLSDLQSDFLYNCDIEDLLYNNCIDDMISDFCDNQVDIYNHRLYKWFDCCDDYYFNEAILIRGTISDIDDFWATLQMAQYLENLADVGSISRDLELTLGELESELEELESELEELESELEELESELEEVEE